MRPSAASARSAFDDLPAITRFGSYDFDLDEDLGPDELWDDQQHRRRARLTEIARANFRVSRNVVRSRQILCDLYDISNGHTGLSQDA